MQNDDTHFEILKIQDGGRRHLEKLKNGHATVRMIGTKFGLVTHIGSPYWTGSENFELFKIKDGRLPPF